MSKLTTDNKDVKAVREVEKTRRALLDAGLEVFAAEGFDGATVEKIARRAKVNKAMISYHFGGKQGLYKAILRANFVVAVERVQALRESKEGAAVILKRFIEEFGGMVASRPTLPTMMLREVLSGGAHLDEELMPAFLSVFATVREIISRGIREGEFRSVNPLMTHLSLVGGMLFFFATGPFRNRLSREGFLPTKMPEPGDFIRHMQDFAGRALAAGAPQNQGVES